MGAFVERQYPMTTPADTAKQTLNLFFNVAYAIAFAAVGFIINMGFTQVNSIEAQLDAVPEKYLLKSDYQYDQQQILKTLESISNKIDHNTEYLEADYNRRMDKLEKILTNTD